MKHESVISVPKDKKILSIRVITNTNFLAYLDSIPCHGEKNEARNSGCMRESSGLELPPNPGPVNFALREP